MRKPEKQRPYFLTYNCYPSQPNKVVDKNIVYHPQAPILPSYQVLPLDVVMVAWQPPCIIAEYQNRKSLLSFLPINHMEVAPLQEGMVVNPQTSRTLLLPPEGAQGSTITVKK